MLCHRDHFIELIQWKLISHLDHSRIFKNYLSFFHRNAAASRQLSSKSNSPNHIQSVQGHMTEDEALAHALARSIQELDESHDRNRRNQQQQQSVACGGGGSNTKDKCSLS